MNERATTQTAVKTPEEAARMTGPEAAAAQVRTPEAGPGAQAAAEGHAEAARELEELARRTGAVLRMVAENPPVDPEIRIPDPVDMARIFAAANAELLTTKPAHVAAVQQAWLLDLAKIRQAAALRAGGHAAEPVALPEKGDRRFADPAWEDDPAFDAVRQAYAATVRRFRELYGAVDGLDPHSRHKLDFYLRLHLNAICPANFPATNPVVLRRARETQGASLRRGLLNLLEDLERGRGRLKIRTTRHELFELGRNLATTPGKVIFRNRLMELIQYAPQTETQYRRPLLIVPPWINKYYILDMRPKNSFVRWAAEQGLTVFLISWYNPDETLREVTFEDYMREGPLTALDVIREQTGEEDANIIGYCIGGTLTACLLAWLAARGEKRVHAATFFTALTDFSEPGDLGVFIDEEQLEKIERYMRRRGYLDAAYMQTVFSLLRDVDLIWNFVINNYLLGNDPPPFDLLYWNDDSTHMPYMMQSFYLRKFYLENRLVEPGGLVLMGEPLDLGKIRIPCYFVATREDHIAPWKSVYKGALRFGGPVRFVVGGSGHIAGIVNPPASGKYGYWVGRRRLPDPDRYLATAAHHEGSWWPDWAAWIQRHSGPRVPARDPAAGPLAPLCDAPGDYVRVRRVD